MPLVHVGFKESPLRVHRSETFLMDLCNSLPKIVADALDTPENPEARLGSKDIEVEVEPHPILSVNKKDIEILILAHDYPERRKNLDERRASIDNAVKKIIPEKYHGFVWIFLGHTSFGSF